MISPSLSSDDDHEARERATRSPSPEVDLSSGPLELESGMVANDDEVIMAGPPTPAGSFGGRSSLGGRDGSQAEGNDVLSTRAASPPLEGDEREFTRTASAMQSKRSFELQGVDGPSQQDESADTNDPVRMNDVDEDVDMLLPAGPESESEEHAERRHSEAAAVLFGQSQEGSVLSTTIAAHAGHVITDPLSKPSSMTGLHISTQFTNMTMIVSPVQQQPTAVGASAATTPIDMDIDVDMDLVVDSKVAFASQSDGTNKNVPDLAWATELQSPETVELAELDDLLGEF